jgi:hypothetical protein
MMGDKKRPNHQEFDPRQFGLLFISRSAASAPLEGISLLLAGKVAFVNPKMK